jgi:hypothetical protein
MVALMGFKEAPGRRVLLRPDQTDRTAFAAFKTTAPPGIEIRNWADQG